jgi:DNA end-binding protein Ku
MPRAIWTGNISFGLVNVPVRLYSAVSRKNVRFHQLDDKEHARIQQKRVSSKTGDEVPYERIVKGYEIAPDQYVVIEPDELDALDPEKTRTIEILDFVDQADIDPIYYDHPYYLAPQPGAEKAYDLLRSAMEEAGKVAIAKVVIRSKESLVAIRPAGAALTMSTMLFHDEVVDPDAIDELPEKAAKPAKKELEMAEQLIGSLAGDFEPERYRDEYRERVLDLIERKAQGEEITVQAPPEEPGKVPDLMSALEASIKAVKDQDEGDGKAPAKRPARKPAGARKRSTTSKASSKNGSGKSGSGRGKRSAGSSSGRSRAKSKS